MAPASAGPQGAPMGAMGSPAPVSHAPHTFSGEGIHDGRDLDARLDRPLLRRTSPLLFVVPLVLLLAGAAVWWFVIRVQPVEVVEETPAVEVPVVPEVPAVVPVPEPVVPEPVPLEPVVTPPAGKKVIATKSGKAGKSGAGKTDGGTKVGGAKVGGASKPLPEPEEPAPRPGQGGKADPGRVIMELEMLSAAKKSLAGNPGQSLAYIEQHDREFPSSQLTDKFDEVRIKALCGLGRGAQARTLAQTILKKRPGSLVGSAIKECKS